jgi:hypothetical protein
MGDAPLTFTRRLLAIFDPIVHAGCRLDEHMFDVRQFGMSALAAG